MQRPASLKDDGDWKSEWAKLLPFLRDVILCGGGVLFGSIPALGIVTGIYWVICLIPGLEFSAGPFASSLSMLFAVALTGGFCLRVACARLNKELELYKGLYEERYQEVKEQQGKIRALSSRLGLPIEDIE